MSAASPEESEEFHSSEEDHNGGLSGLAKFLASSLTPTNIMDTSETPITSATQKTTVRLTTATTAAPAEGTTTQNEEEDIEESMYPTDSTFGTYDVSSSSSSKDVLFTTHVIKEPLLPQASFAPGAITCPALLRRTLEWPRTAAGKEAVLPCPLGTQGEARWFCSEEGEWTTAHPDLSGCRSLWLAKIHEQLRTPSLAASHLAKETAHYAASNRLYGGDLPALLSALGALAEKTANALRQVPTDGQREAVVVETVQALVKAASLAAGRANLPAWLDLPDRERRRALTVAARTLRSAGLLLPEAARENQEITISSPNICKWGKIKRTKIKIQPIFFFLISSDVRQEAELPPHEPPEVSLRRGEGHPRVDKVRRHAGRPLSRSDGEHGAHRRRGRIHGIQEHGRGVQRRKA